MGRRYPNSKEYAMQYILATQNSNTQQSEKFVEANIVTSPGQAVVVDSLTTILPVRQP